MIKMNRKIVIAAMVLVLIGIIFVAKFSRKAAREEIKIITPVIGTVQTVVTSTATVLPQNRLEVKPPINGRIEKILVKEGDDVKAGTVLAWMSSTERAALLDAANGYGPETVKYWEDVYRPTPLIPPIDGEVIVSTDQPGQTVTASDAIIVLSDHLIVQAQVDETDVGRIKLGQAANISLDAYPEIKVGGIVDHIYYESKMVNNVTIYQVDIVPDTVPEVFRSGMTATVNIIENSKNGVLTIPVDAVRHGKDGACVLLSQGLKKKPKEAKVVLGLSDESTVEIISGISKSDKILVTSQKYIPSKSKAGANPFMPARPKKKE